MKKIISIIITFVLGISLCTTITSCTNQSDNTSKISHTHHYVWVDNGDGTHKQHCQNQGCQEPDINYGNHTYDSNGICICGAIKQEEHIHNYIWVDNGDGTHKQHCENEGCDAIDINEGPHNFNDEGICIQCGATREEEIPDGQLLKFQLNEDGTSYSVLGANENSITDIVIPSTYEGLPVTTIAENAFRIYENQRFGLTSIFIPQSITTIENYAFFNATSLTSIVIPESVINLGSQLFRYSAIKKAEFYSSIVPESCSSK